MAESKIAMMMLQRLSILIIYFGIVSAGRYSREWSDEVAKIVYAKIDYLLANGIEVTQRFDLNNTDAESDYTKYVYDPTLITTTVDCLDKTHGKCKRAWFGDRPADIAFSSRKLLRLAFHDCVPYEKPNYGRPCDGCINLDTDDQDGNLEHNNGLQYTVAVLEKLWLEPDFPENTPILPKSLKEMRLSRADLWAFASLVALNDYWLKTRSECSGLHGFKATCGDFPCYPAPLDNVLKMFKTGRDSCSGRAKKFSKKGEGDFLGYLAGKRERHPNQNDNGVDTVNYYKEHIKLQPRESLALMGIHTIGHFNRMTSHNNYGWSNGLTNRMDLWSNEYFRNLAQLPQKIYPIFGNCNDRVQKNRTFMIQPSFANQVWPSKDPWCEPGRPGRLFWLLTVDNGTAAGERKTEHTKMISADMGYAWKFHFDENGLPRGCNAFKHDDPAWYAPRFSAGMNDCPKQDLLDEHGIPLYDAVVMYGENATLWMHDFVEAYIKMQQNGWTKLTQGPSKFWSHKCKFLSSDIFD